MWPFDRTYETVDFTKGMPEVKPKTEISDFVAARIKEKIGGADTIIAYKQHAICHNYEEVILTSTERIKIGDSPNLHTRERRTNLLYYSVDKTSYIKTNVFIDNDYVRDSTGGWAGVDDNTYCALINQNWTSFLAAIGSIADQIKKDLAGREETAKVTANCRSEVLKKIEMEK